MRKKEVWRIFGRFRRRELEDIVKNQKDTLEIPRGKMSYLETKVRFK